MDVSLKFSRREALGLGLGAASAMLLPRGASAQEQMEILVAYYGALINSSVVAVGLEKGYYDTPAVKVTEAVSSIGGGTAIRNMVGGGVEYGFVGTSAALSAIKQGIDIKIVHGGIRTMQDLFWVSMPGSGIKSIEDLKGKKIGFTKPKSISETMANWMLDRHHLKGEVETVSLGAVGAGLSALESGGVDAALILEPLWSARKDKYQIAFTLAELPPITQMVGVATSNMIAKKPDALRDLVSAWTKEVDFTYANPEEAAKLISKRVGANTLPEKVAISAVKNMADIHYWSRGDIDIKGLNFWLQTMKEQGEWEGDADWASMIDQSFLEKDLQTASLK